MSIGLYRGLAAGGAEEGAAEGGPADGDLDICTCPICSCGQPHRASGHNAATPLLAHGLARGPVQDESGAVDPIDAAAMRAVEGRADDHVIAGVAS